MTNLFLPLLRIIFALFKDSRDLVLENLALHQQLLVYKRLHPRPQLRHADRLFWVWLSKVWNGWRNALVIVKPETVISWHRKGFKLFWTKISQRKRAGPASSKSADSCSDQADGRSEPAMGSTTHSWGVAQVGHPNFRKNRLAAAAQVQEATLSAMAHLPQQPSP
jgi:hypothetical protein